MFRPLLPALLILVSITASAQTTPTTLQGAYWGSEISPPNFGYNARVINKFVSDGCGLPDTSLIGSDWRSTQFRNNIARLHPEILRYPGGTDANYWYWSNETRMIVGANGQLQEVQICEGTFIDIPESIDIGCVEPWIELNAETFQNIVSRTTTTISSFIETLDYYKNEKGINVQEMYVLSVFDPLYYIGSPQFEYEYGDLSNVEKRNKLGELGVLRAVKQINTLLNAYCGNCATYDGEVLFELGNETFLRRYGLFLPRMDCFDLPSPCDGCFVDVDLYGDISEFLIPYIKTRFPNSQIALAAGRFKIGGKAWNAPLIERFGPNAAISAEALNIHTYPTVIYEQMLTSAICSGDVSGLDVDDLLKEHMYDIYKTLMRRGTFQLEGSGMDLWLTEFNVNNRSESCLLVTDTAPPQGELLFYLSTWLQTLTLFGQMNSFFQYSVPEGAPWFWYTYHVPITDICIHSMYRHPAVSAILQSDEISASGMMTMIMSPLLREHNSIRQIILFQPDANIALHDDGSIPEAEVDNIQPLIIPVEPSEINGLNETYPAQGVMSWAFESDTSLKVLAVNISNQHLFLDLSTIPGMSEIVETYAVGTIKEEVFTRIHTGFESPHIEQSEQNQSSASISLAPYTVCVIRSNLNEQGPPSGPCPALASDVPGLNSNCGSSPCSDCDCDFQAWNNADFEVDMGIWNAVSASTDKVSIQTLPGSIQNTAPFLGSKSLRMLSGTPYATITTPVINTNATSRIRVRFKYGAIGMVDADDRIVLSYSTDGGQTFLILSSWRYGEHFENGTINQAAVITQLAKSPQTQFRLRGRSDGTGKTFLIDNLELSYCGPNAQGIGSAPIVVAPAQVNESLSIDLYPNPSQNEVNLLFAAEEEERISIEIFNVAGVKQSETFTLGTSGLQHELLDVSDLASGIYFVRVSCPSGTGVKKLIR